MAYIYSIVVVLGLTTAALAESCTTTCYWVGDYQYCNTYCY